MANLTQGTVIVTPESRPPVRDTRVDDIFYVQTLLKQVAEPLKAAVKAQFEHLLNSVHRTVWLEGEVAKSTVSLQTITSVDANKFMKSYEQGEITRSQFIEAISVKKEQASKHYSAGRLRKMLIHHPNQISMTVQAKDGEISVRSAADGARNAVINAAVPAAPAQTA